MNLFLVAEVQQIWKEQACLAPKNHIYVGDYVPESLCLRFLVDTERLLNTACKVSGIMYDHSHKFLI